MSPLVNVLQRIEFVSRFQDAVPPKNSPNSHRVQSVRCMLRPLRCARLLHTPSSTPAFDFIAQEWLVLLEALVPHSCTWTVPLRDTKQLMQPIRQQVLDDMDYCELPRALCQTLAGQDTPASRAINLRSNELFTSGANWISAQIISEVNRVSVSLLECFFLILPITLRVFFLLHESFNTKWLSAPSRLTLPPRPSCFFSS